MSEPPRKRRRGPHQLPAGRHGIPREDVARHQRERILEAVATVVAAQGYPATSVEDIIAAAGVSRRSFYDHYRGKEEAFLASYDLAVAVLMDGVREAYARGGGFEQRMAACLHAFVDTLCRHPTYAYMCIVQVLGAGPAATERRNRAIREYGSLIARAADEDLPKRGRPPELIAQTVVGGIYEVVYTRVLEERMDELPALAPELLFSILLPYVGRDAALAALQRERRRSRAA